MRLCRVYTKDIEPFFAVILQQRILRIHEAAKNYALAEKELTNLTDMESYLENLPKSEKSLRLLLKSISDDPKRLARPASDGKPTFLPGKDIQFLPPVKRPSKILCIGLNYRDHCEEQGKEVPKKPIVFNKFSSSMVPHEGEVKLPLKYDKCVDFEAEFAVVIGKKATRVTKRTAMKHVAGYTIVNDLSCRTLQANEKQWSRAKGFDDSCPIGPIIVTPDEIPDPHNLEISMKLNGKTMQKSNTSNLIFQVQDLISFISQVITLEPGDIISTGTPGGVGVHRDPQVFLQPNDKLDVYVERIGHLVNTCVK